MREAIHDSLNSVLADISTPPLVREIERGGSCAGLWKLLEETAFMDALVPESLGGSGLNLSDVLPIPILCGRYVVPAPVAETTILRGLLAQGGNPIPEGRLTLASGQVSPGGAIICSNIPLGRLADRVVVQLGDQVCVLPASTATLGPAVFVLDASMAWSPTSAAAAEAVTLGVNVKLVQAFIYAAQLSGALAAVFERTLDYANQRQQFGRAIGKFQVIQHNLALMAEQLFSARMAVELSVSPHGRFEDRRRIAAAKARTSEAAVEISAIAHAIHGAIGFTEEYDLQLFTRRLNAWRLAAGSESYWFADLGTALLQDQRPQVLDFLRELNPA